MTYNIKELLSKSIRAVEQRGVDELNADYPFMMANSQVFNAVCEELIKEAENLNVDYVAGIEATGLPFAGILAHALKKGLIMIRKENKLPGDVVLSDSYFLPYKKINNKLEMQKDLDLKDKTILLFDEAIDTGATLKTAIDLIKKFEPEKIIILTISNFPNIKSFNDIEVLSLVYGPY